MREREEIAPAALAGIWNIDPGDDYPELESYVLTHRDIAYTPTSAHRHAAVLAAGAEAALREAEASALRDFVVGKLPKAISRGWETMMDRRREVNDKMRNARASSGVSVQVKLSVRTDLSAHARPVYELLCKTADGQRLPEARAQVGTALQALIAAAEGDDMHARVENAVKIADWVDVSYEVTREGTPPPSGAHGQDYLAASDGSSSSPPCSLQSPPPTTASPHAVFALQRSTKSESPRV